MELFGHEKGAFTGATQRRLGRFGNLSSIIDKITRQGPMGSQDDWDETVLPVGRGAEGFDVTPDGKQIWVANAQDDTISVLDAAGKKVVDTLNERPQREPTQIHAGWISRVRFNIEWPGAGDPGCQDSPVT